MTVNGVQRREAGEQNTAGKSGQKSLSEFASRDFARKRLFDDRGFVTHR